MNINPKFDTGDYVKLVKKYLSVMNIYKDNEWLIDIVYQIKKFDHHDNSYLIEAINYPPKKNRARNEFPFNIIWVEEKEIKRAKDYEVQAAKYNL